MRATLRKQVELNFGAVSDAIATRIDAAGEPALNRYLEGVLTADSVDAVFGG